MSRYFVVSSLLFYFYFIFYSSSLQPCYSSKLTIQWVNTKKVNAPPQPPPCVSVLVFAASSVFSIFRGAPHIYRDCWDGPLPCALPRPWSLDRSSDDAQRTLPFCVVGILHRPKTEMEFLPPLPFFFHSWWEVRNSSTQYLYSDLPNSYIDPFRF
ncbi:hypothetical protein QBC42DRAFT_97388 [Cladorrhinum samala]|uniref:Secreted protein n=1 Tax=Cladorrhinum samala TaxID=585594 RepID=A0AAV9HND2_9PEZI|nr:hypothetical protein QBC42DRAFT_97388 [Cladorrhinum samala]